MTDKEIIRKLKHNLYISGIGVIALGIWGCLKATMTLYLSEGGLDTLGIDAEILPLYWGVLLIMLIVLNVIIIAFHLFVGLNAMRAGKKGNKKKAYLYVAAFMGLITLATIAGDIEPARGDLTQIDVVIASILVDLMFIFIVFDIIYSSVKIGKLEKLQLDEGAQ